ncbi:L,D-transpeptidase [Egbenema bharatensis]|uniref:L,D-transpeptidase n=1 Tax=Egbenema bharatensis TaxID=3463334 RepID=UPI003A892C77
MNSQNRSRFQHYLSQGARAGLGLWFGFLSLSLGLAFSGSIASLGLLPQPVQAQDWLHNRMTELQHSNTRWIQVNLSTQRLIAWEGGTPVYAIIVSTGTTNHPTLSGSFAVQSKHRIARMQGDTYDVPDVPFVMYYDGNYGIHGTYWHNRFGTPMSHGCVNVAVDHAEWLYNWAAIGTPVVVHY